MITASKKRMAARVADKLLDTRQQATDPNPPKWYNNDGFPLLPNYGTRPPDDNNTRAWWFNWVFIRIWGLDSFSFSIEAVLDDHWGLGVIGNLPYVRWAVCIPCPYKVQLWCMKHLWRRSKNSKQNL